MSVVNNKSINKAKKKSKPNFKNKNSKTELIKKQKVKQRKNKTQTNR